MSEEGAVSCVHFFIFGVAVSSMLHVEVGLVKDEGIRNDLSQILKRNSFKQLSEEHGSLETKLDTLLEKQGSNILTLMEKINQLEQSMTSFHTKVSQIEARLSIIDTNIGVYKNEIEEFTKRNNLIGNSGTTYIRWGRSSCPGNGSETIYSGYAGGSHYTHEGGAVSMLCLPSHPDWANYDDTVQASTGAGYVYGVEYHDVARDGLLFKKNNFEQDVPCAVCEVSKRSESIMIPAKTSCYPGWTIEYRGYIMSGHFTHKAASDYFCVDANPENVFGGYSNHDGYRLYFVEGRCGSLKCPPYREGRELACVVCTK